MVVLTLVLTKGSIKTDGGVLFYGVGWGVDVGFWSWLWIGGIRWWALDWFLLGCFNIKGPFDFK